ncbi:MAG: hypothetical protein JSU86_15075 [Phycisphaerales bacterium]|nr:MAG: hypothetical protein JSU86_15075 [Phycisphaerales bacterium]
MTRRMKIVGTLAAIAVLVVSVCVLVAPDAALAKGKPKPPPCPCPETIELPDGTVCVLEACGFDCVYTCPFPF